jgi:hypothetical protein
MQRRKKLTREEKQRRHGRLKACARPYLPAIHNATSGDYRSLLGSLKQEPLPVIDFTLSRAFENPATKRLITTSAFPTKFDMYKASPDRFSGSLIAELNWNAAVLSQYANEVNAFTRLAEALEQSLLGTSASEAREIYDEIVAQFGRSLWSLEVGLLLEELEGGVPAVRQFLDGLEHISDPTTRSFAELFAERVEAAVSAANYDTTVDSLLTRIEARYKSTFFGHYLRYFLNFHRMSTFTDATLGQPLHFAGTTGLIDRYTTFIHILQLLHAVPSVVPSDKISPVIALVADSFTSCTFRQNRKK